MAQGYTYNVLVNITKDLKPEETKDMEGYDDVGKQEFCARMVREVR